MHNRTKLFVFCSISISSVEVLSFGSLHGEYKATCTRVVLER